MQGISISLQIRKAINMNAVQQALARIQTSISNAEAKIDSLKASQGVTDEQLQPIADALNAASDALDVKVAE